MIRLGLALMSLGFCACSSGRALEIDASVPAIPRPDSRPPVADPPPIAAPAPAFNGVCLDGKQAEVLLRSLADAQRWIEECRARLDYYGERN